MTRQCGTVKKIFADKGFGFISRVGEADCFFHRTELAHGMEFDEQLLERRVNFFVVSGQKGQAAKNIEPETN